MSHHFPQFKELTGISYCLHLIDIIVIYDFIESGIKLVQEIYHLIRCAAAGKLSEANYVTVKHNKKHIATVLTTTN